MKINGDSHNWQKWLIGLFTAAILTGGASLVRMVVIDAERITTLEAQSEHHGKQLDRIEAKIDRLLLTK